MRCENLVIGALGLPVLIGAGSLTYVIFEYNALWALPVSGLVLSIIAAVLIRSPRFGGNAGKIQTEVEVYE